MCLGNEPVRLGGQIAGRVTSGGYGYTVGRSIAYAYLPVPAGELGAKVEVGVFGEWVTAEIAREPLYDPGGERVRSLDRRRRSGEDGDVDVIETDLESGDGRRLHVYDTGGDGAAGSPSSGTTARRTSARLPSRCSRPPPGSASAGCRTTGPDTADRPPARAGTWPRRPPTSPRIADALGIGRFAVMGHSGGGPHALACARAAARSGSSAWSAWPGRPRSAPRDSTGSRAWSASGVASLRAAAAGRAAKERHEAAAEYDPEMFTPADHAALSGEWSWFGDVVGRPWRTARAG